MAPGPPARLSTIESSDGANTDHDSDGADMIPEIDDVLVQCSDDGARPGDAADSAAFFS